MDDEETKPEEDDYEIGYKMPPRHTRFKLGQCANPNGRRGNRPPTLLELTDAQIIAKIDNELMLLGKRWISCLEAQLRKLRAMSVSGDIRAANLLDEIRQFDTARQARQGGVLLLPPPVTLSEWIESARIQQAPFREQKAG